MTTEILSFSTWGNMLNIIISDMSITVGLSQLSETGLIFWSLDILLSLCYKQSIIDSGDNESLHLQTQISNFKKFSGPLGSSLSA